MHFKIIAILSYCYVCTALPEFLKVCRRDDPKLDECARMAADSLRPHLAKGIPELDIPPCEPLLMPEIDITQEHGAVIIKFSHRDVRIWGPSNFTLKTIKIDVKNDRVYLQIDFPRLTMKSDYKIDGKVLLMPIEGSGIFHANYSGISANITLQMEKKEINGTTYLHCKSSTLDFVMAGASVQLDNLYDGNDKMAHFMNNMLNENWESVHEEMKPLLENMLNNVIMAYANSFYKKYPIDVLLPQ